MGRMRLSMDQCLSLLRLTRCPSSSTPPVSSRDRSELASTTVFSLSDTALTVTMSTGSSRTPGDQAGVKPDTFVSARTAPRTDLLGSAVLHLREPTRSSVKPITGQTAWQSPGTACERFPHAPGLSMQERARFLLILLGTQCEGSSLSKHSILLSSPNTDLMLLFDPLKTGFTFCCYATNTNISFSKEDSMF